jgi:hypothetical protein
MQHLTPTPHLVVTDGEAAIEFFHSAISGRSAAR